MARLPNDQIERIKTDISLLRLVEGQGYKVIKQGKDHAVACPFHDDLTPSLIISPKSNLYHCFGCGAAGSVIDWVMKTQSLAFREAAVWLSNECLPLAVETQKEKTPSPLAAKSLAAEKDDQALLQRVIAFYHETLKQNVEAQDYLKSRGLDDVELIDYFKLGYANRSLGLTLPHKTRKAGEEIRTHLQAVGLYRESGHEHFNGSLVVPVIDEQGKITEVYGRKLLGNLRKGTPKHLYLPGPHAGVFNPSCLQSEEIILCESLIDALTFWRWGFKHVTTSYGTEGFTSELFNAFKQHKTKRVLIAYDRDEAGNLAAEKLSKQLVEAGIACYRILFPKSMDANEYALKMSPADKALGLVIRKAEWMGEGSDPAQLVKVVDQQATPKPALPLDDVQIQENDRELFITFGSREYRVRGHDKNTGYDQLKIQLLVQRDDMMHMDKLDLYSSKQRQVFINQACVELGVKDDIIKKDLTKILLTLEDRQSKKTAPTIPQSAQMTEEEKQAALELLRDPSLLSRLLEDFERAGVIGEETNKLVGYLACVSRKLDKPLAVMIQSSSAAGKSSLMDSVLNMMPEEERVQYSAMTGQSLFYMGETNLKHKILAVAEEEGARAASYALKLLQSEGEVTIASTSKDESSGDLVTKEYKVEGPVMLFFTTTAIDSDEELVNRCLVLSVNEDDAQTAGIHASQRDKRTVEGREQSLLKKQVVQLHQNAQRLLKTVNVVNPYARDLTFPTHKVRLRRDNEKYLTLIETIAFLHQYQRKEKVYQCGGEPLKYIEVTLDDIELANRLAAEVLGKTLDELPQQTRKLLTLMTDWIKQECQTQGIEQQDFRFSRRHVRELCGWSETQVRTHIKRLVDMEYLLTHSGQRGQSFEYELIYSGEGHDGHMFLSGLIDIKELRAKMNARKKAPVIPMTTTSRGKE